MTKVKKKNSITKRKWKDKYIIQAYELIKNGSTEHQISKIFGIAFPTFRYWRETKPIFDMAIREGRKAYKRKGIAQNNLKSYIYKRLSPELQELWKKLNKLDKAKCGTDRIEALLENKGTSIRQHLFLYALTSNNFSFSSALRKVNISKSTFDCWRKNDPEFSQLVEEINWHKKNFFEDHLTMLIRGGDTSATIFANRTYNKDRGYGVEGNNLNLNLTQNIQHNYLPIKVEQLNLPLEVRKEILKSIQEQKQLLLNP
jgi:hypothetical protein